jgi:hypothetical protein
MATISIPSTISAPTFYDTSGVRDWQYDIDTADSPTTITSYSPPTAGLPLDERSNAILMAVEDE